MEGLAYAAVSNALMLIVLFWYVNRKIKFSSKEVKNITPNKAKLIEYCLHPVFPNHVLVKYERPNGFSTHTVEFPQGKTGVALEEWLKTCKAADV